MTVCLEVKTGGKPWQKKEQKDKSQKIQVLKSYGLNSWKVVMRHKNYRKHVDVRWQDVTCPEPTVEQWRASWKHSAEYREKEVQEGTKKEGKGRVQ